MGHGTSRREFVTKALMGAAAASLPLSAVARAASNPGPGPLRRLEAFDYDGVTLLDGPLLSQIRAMRAYYLAIPTTTS